MANKCYGRARAHHAVALRSAYLLPQVLYLKSGDSNYFLPLKALDMLNVGTCRRSFGRCTFWQWVFFWGTVPYTLIVLLLKFFGCVVGHFRGFDSERCLGDALWSVKNPAVSYQPSCLLVFVFFFFQKGKAWIMCCCLCDLYTWLGVSTSSMRLGFSRQGGFASRSWRFHPSKSLSRSPGLCCSVFWKNSQLYLPKVVDASHTPSRLSGWLRKVQEIHPAS